MKRKKKSRFTLFVVSIVTVLLVWSFAFLVWLFWGDIEGFFKSGGSKRTPQETVKPPQEKILEEERKKLEEILKRR